jgi:hypothetical protein
MSWQTRFDNPTVLAASVASLTTLLITFVTAISGLITASIQASTDRSRDAMENKRELLAQAFQGTGGMEGKLQFFINSGALPDDDCKLRIAILHYTANCTPPK